MKTLLLSIALVVMQLLTTLCTGTKPNGDQVKLVSDGRQSYEHGDAVEKQTTTMTQAQFSSWASNKGYKTECP